ncbi:MAG: multicopper oxidase domain-containing protein [Planctomycetota bacterium]|jgi:hypothetical protein|nr:multicopper oxidase domain-containing protein [Planctomycetota bacterium]
MALPLPPVAPATVWRLTADPSSTTFGNGVTIPFFRYNTNGTRRGALPFAQATEGSSLTVLVTNNLPHAFRPEIVGVATGPLIRPGTSASFSFNMPPAGTYLLSADGGKTAPAPGNFGAAHISRPTNGLSGTLVSRPSSGAQVLYDGGPAYDREYVLLYDDADDRRNALQGSLGSIPRQPYEANYFTLNGMGFPDIAGDTDSVVAAGLGERVLLRLGNLGRTRQCIHFHGFHADTATRDNLPEIHWGEKDTIPVPTRTTTDVLFTANQLGTYPLHPHNVQAVTADGAYPFGQLTLIVVS